MRRRAFFHLLSLPLGTSLVATACDRKKSPPPAASGATLAPDAPVDPAFSSCAA